MTPRFPAWRYQNEGRMPWYRSVRLYRSPIVEQEGWHPVISRISGDLNELIHMLSETPYVESTATLNPAYRDRLPALCTRLSDAPRHFAFQFVAAVAGAIHVEHALAARWCGPPAFGKPVAHRIWIRALVAWAFASTAR